MAYAQTTVSSSTTLVIGGIYDLQYPANQYDIIGIEIQRSANGSSSWSTVASQLFFPPTSTNNFLAISATNQIIQYYYRTFVSLQYQGVNYNFTSSVVQMPKQSQSAPSAPTLNTASQSSITLNSVSGCEYRIGTGSAQSSTLFSGLNVGTSYSFQQRRAETSTLQASAWSSSATFSTTKYTQPAPSAPTLNTRGVGFITLNTIGGGEYRKDLGSAQSSSNFTGLSPGNSYGFQQRYAETSIYYASPWSSTANISTLSLGQPTNVSVAQPTIGTAAVDLYYQWGSNATGNDIRWSNDQVNWNNFTDQQQNNYPSPNYWFNVSTFTNKYFQVRSRRLENGNLYYSNWVNAIPYPILVSELPPYGEIYAPVGGVFNKYPVFVAVGGTFIQADVRYHNGTTWVSATN